MVPPDQATPRSWKPWTWIPTLYYAEGIPYVLVTGASIAMYKDLGLQNSEIAFYTSWIAAPWVLKPLWSPLVEMWKTRRWWIWILQLVMGAGFASVAFSLTADHMLRCSLALFLLIAFASATHDIAADGFYLMALTEEAQSFFSGIRNTFYRLAMICGQGLLLILVGTLAKQSGGSEVQAWRVAMLTGAGALLVLTIWQWLMLPRPGGDQPGNRNSTGVFTRDFGGAFAAFLQKPRLLATLFFLLFYRFGEAQLVKMVQPFLLDARAAGGLGLDDGAVGWLYGTNGVAALLLGGIAGGVLVSRQGLRFWLWPMVIIMHVPDVVYVYLAHAQPQSHAVIGACLAAEQFGYGFGFTAYMLYMIYVARGSHQTAHYAICTAFMALGAMLPGMASGWLEQKLGYPNFFVWVLLATIPGFIAAAIVKIDPGFGRRGNGGGYGG